MIVIAGETYSANLGDGVIADTMRFLFQKVAPGCHVVNLDISGRAAYEKATQFPLETSETKRFRLEESWLNLLKWRLVRQKRCLASWQPVLTDADILVIGGGQLLMDNALDFPLKINNLTQLATSLGVQTHFSACGVGKHWSNIANRLFFEALGTAKTITVRDRYSLQRLPEIFASRAELMFDPAIWAADVYGCSSIDDKQEENLIGLGVIGLESIKKHNAEYTTEKLFGFWEQIVCRLKQEKTPFEIFTNGSISDYAFARELADFVEKKWKIYCPLAERPITPHQLACNISRYQSVIAARLHANILALAYAIPAVGLVWDDKVRSFYEDTDRPEFCFDIDSVNPDTVINAVLQVARQGIKAEVVDLYKEKALTAAKLIIEASGWVNRSL